MFDLGTSFNNAHANVHLTAGWSNFTITLPGQVIVETAVVIPSYQSSNNLEIVAFAADWTVTY